MRRWLLILMLCVAAILAGRPAPAIEPPTNRVLVLCYHDVPVRVNNDPHAVDVASFVDQIEYMRTHGAHFVSPADLEAARAGKRPLPAKAVMLSFDDGYVTFASNVVPVLELYRIPAMLAICSSWIDDKPPPDIAAPLMSWPQIKELVRNPLVTVVSHSHALHRAVQCNPQGNTAQAAVTHMYSPETRTYETEAAYKARIQADLDRSKAVFRERLGTETHILVWPYGEYSGISRDLAAAAGFRMAFGLFNTTASLDNLMELDRWIILGNPSARDFIEDFRYHTELPVTPRLHIRGLSVSLDLIYDPDPARQEQKLGRFLDRIVVLKPSTVFVEAAADPEHAASAVYFPNRVLPMRSDLLSRVVNQLYIRGFQVFVSMPTLSVQLTDEGKNRALAVLESRGGGLPAPVESAPPRLSPFAPATTEILCALYEDMAMHCRFQGVLFRDDAWLSAHEDFQADALKAAQVALKMDNVDPDRLNGSQAAAWAALKTGRLNHLTDALMQAVRRHRPLTLFARSLDAAALDGDAAGNGRAQNYADAVSRYDYAVISIPADRANALNGKTDLEEMVKKVVARPDALDKTVFMLPARKERGGQWLDTSDLLHWTRRMVAVGAHHMAYGPDNFAENKPELGEIRMEYSAEALLFKRPVPRKVTPQY